jgi:hypothetical protein
VAALVLTGALTFTTACAEARSDAGTTPKSTAPRPDPAAEHIAADGPGWETRAGERALALVDYPWRELGWSVRFTEGREGMKAATYVEQRAIEVYVRPNRRLIDVAHDLVHELGHAVDLTYGSPERREKWKQARGIPSDAGWLPCSSCPDLATPAGDFAESFALYVLDRRADFLGRLRPPPTRAELARLEWHFWPEGHEPS